MSLPPHILHLTLSLHSSCPSPLFGSQVQVTPPMSVPHEQMLDGMDGVHAINTHKHLWVDFLSITNTIHKTWWVDLLLVHQWNVIRDTWYVYTHTHNWPWLLWLPSSFLTLAKSFMGCGIWTQLSGEATVKSPSAGRKCDAAKWYHSHTHTHAHTICTWATFGGK